MFNEGIVTDILKGRELVLVVGELHHEVVDSRGSFVLQVFAEIDKLHVLSQVVLSD